MKSHAIRPLYVVIAIVVVILVARAMVVPEDFGIQQQGYMYGWHKKSDEDFWKQFKVKYQGRDYCKDCHSENYEMIMQSPHAIIQCENCHGPAIDHPSEPAKLEINKEREMCLRCHSKLPYEQTGRAHIPGIDKDKHNPGMECVMCHNPHKPGFD